MRISSYTKTHNCYSASYPFKKSIASMLAFSDEVVVLDSGSDDGTFDAIEYWAKSEPKLKVGLHKVDFSKNDFAYEGDGLQKARARAMCTGDVLFQFDCDEIVMDYDAPKVRRLCEDLYEHVGSKDEGRDSVFIFPMVEFWGRSKFRADIPFWKPRISFGAGDVTHGIPTHCRHETEDGKVFSSSSDGCDFVKKSNGDMIYPSIPFDLNQFQFLTQARTENVGLYQNGLLRLVSDVGTIYHYSWYDMPRKIRTYRDYWTKHWNSLFNGNLEDTAENNMFFDKPWSEVTEEEIGALAERLENEMGGWIFHRRVDFSRPSKWIDTKYFEDAGFKLWRPN